MRNLPGEDARLDARSDSVPVHGMLIDHGRQRAFLLTRGEWKYELRSPGTGVGEHSHWIKMWPTSWALNQILGFGAVPETATCQQKATSAGLQSEPRPASRGGNA